MSNREPIKIIEPGIRPKLFGAAVLSVILLAGAARAGSHFFAAGGGQTPVSRGQFTDRAGESIKNLLYEARARLVQTGDRWRAVISRTDTGASARTPAEATAD